MRIYSLVLLFCLSFVSALSQNSWVQCVCWQSFFCLETAIFNFKSIFSTVPLSHLFLLTILIADNHKMNFCIEVEKNTENQYLKPKRWIWPGDRPSYPAGFPEAVLWRRDALSVWWGRGKILNTAKKHDKRHFLPVEWILGGWNRINTLSYW